MELVGVSAIYKLSINIYRLAHQKMTKAYINNDQYQYVYQPCYFEGILFISHNWKQNGYQNSNRYMGPRAATLFFDDDESKYELWEVMFQGYLRIQHFHQIILSSTDQNDDMDFVEKNDTISTKLIQYLDNKSVISNKRCMKQWKKILHDIKGTLFV